jgi:YbgC/YbaW family acyl-CoA thioester hydrolase
VATEHDLFSRDALVAAPAGFHHRILVRFQDVDAAGIIFFARLFEYFHDAYVAFLAHHGVSLAAVMRAGTWAAPLTHADADFLNPCRFGDALDVGPVRAVWHGSRVEIGHRVAFAEGGKIVAVGRTTHMLVDRKTFQRIPPPADLAAAMATLPG